MRVHSRMRVAYPLLWLLGDEVVRDLASVNSGIM